MKICALGVLSGIFLLQACGGPVYHQPKVSYQGIHPLVVQKTSPQNTSQNSLQKASQTLITINGMDYSLPKPCSMARSFGSDTDSRQFGEDADSRQFGDDADSRQFGDLADSRQFGDDADSRQFGGDADSRQFGDDADSRQFGDDADSRQFGGDADSRQFGDDADSRQFGDLADSRQFGDDADSRQFGGDTDSRQFGHLSNQFKCIKVASMNAVIVTGLVGHEVVNVVTGDEFLNYKRENNNIILKY